MKPLALMVRDIAAPVLRRHGFKRSSGTFRSVSDRGVAVIQISGRGAIQTHDLDFHVAIGFTTHDHLASSPTLAGVKADQLQVAIGSSTWHDVVRDPGLTAMDLNQRWSFNRGDSAMERLFVTVLDMAAEDVLHRLECWPEMPQDSLSRPPVFRVPIEQEARSRWRTGSDGRLDLHYAASSPIERRIGIAGPQTFKFGLLHDHHDPAVMIGIDAAALDALANGSSLDEWAPVVGLRSAAGRVPLPLGPTPEGIDVRDAASDSWLVIDPVDGYPEARFSLGELPQPLWTRANAHRFVQVVLIEVDTEGMQALTWQSRIGLAGDGRVWWATVRAEP
ncbi:hypothetical protein [Knoellia koreensis]|uniref:Uncharacterized protein n=1 Tax=Knoellia koreensis TaxID=2730921 RepID=A0A849HK31_9MICO|nr:hypothetical protein [Knoellia sp. DB2414S]NNM46691.1 hypothetical protein [Knoellia sp. DB2414S]